MENGIRFDLEYETMPWHRVDAVVFDIGNMRRRIFWSSFSPATSRSRGI